MRLLVTRQREDAGSLVDALAGRGFEVLARPLIRIEPLSDEPIDTTPYEWVIVTSPNGAREFARLHVGTPPRIAAIGPATAATLAEEGFTVELTPAEHSQEGLVAAFPEQHGRVLFAGAEGARRVIVEELGADFLPLYRTHELRPHDLPQVDAVVLLSPSAARAYAAAGGGAPALSIGPQTSRAARAAGLTVVAEAASADIESLVDSAAAWRDSSRS